MYIHCSTSFLAFVPIAGIHYFTSGAALRFRTQAFRVIPKEIKEQVQSRVKIDGVSGTQAAKDAGICADTVRNWLAKTADGVNNEASENTHLKRELAGVYELLGKLTADFAGFKKKYGHWS